MESVKIELSKDIKELEIILFADEHVGDEHCNINDIKKRIEYVQNTENAYAILGGDLMDNATKTSIGDTYRQTMSPMEQIDTITEMFKPIRKKILGCVMGNHENRTYKKEGIDPMKCVCDRLDIASRYSPTGLLLFVRFGNLGAKYHNRKITYTIYVTHGSGGGRKEGAKILRLVDLAGIVDADVYVHCHSHLGIICKEDFHRTNWFNSSVEKITKLFVNSSAALEYGGYGESIGCKPSSIDRPVILLNGTIKESKAIL